MLVVGGLLTVLLIGYLAQVHLLPKRLSLVLSVFAIFFWDAISMDTSDADLFPEKVGRAILFSLGVFIVFGISIGVVFAVFLLVAVVNHHASGF